MEPSEKLTKYPEGSIRELWTISFPLMISTLATLLMIFVDRIFLAEYSLESLNAAAHAGTWAWAFIGGLGVLTGMSEIFVSQYNGAGMRSKIGVPVWQMIWASLVSLVVFIVLAVWGAPILYANSPYQALETEYFSILMFFGPAYAWMTALSGFFIGRGKTRMLIWIAIIANLINIVLDWILIFGIEGWVPEMGIRGAALATSIGYLFEGSFLFFFFLQKKYRKEFGSSSWRFDPLVFRKCFKVGFPQGLFYFLEIIGFALFYQMMTRMGEVHITISSICQSILILLSFFYDGLSRGVAAIAGNFIGGNRYAYVGKVLKSGLYLQLLFIALLVTFFALDFHHSVQFLLPQDWKNYSLSWFTEFGISSEQVLVFCLFCTFIYIGFEGIRWVLAGILTAAGDTLFLLIAGPICVWLFLLLPVYLFVVKYSASVQTAWLLIAAYGLFTCILYAVRLFQGKWKNIQIIDRNEQSVEVDQLAPSLQKTEWVQEKDNDLP